MKQAAVFMTNHSQTELLPKSAELPAEDTWSSWFSKPGVSNDFNHEQPARSALMIK